MVSLRLVAMLMALMATKHLVADFFLQSGSIARGKAAAQGWLLPLSVHAGTHAALTLIVALVLFPFAWWVAPVEFVVHAAIDRGKVMIGRRVPLDMTKPGFWWLFGLDQYLHEVTNIAIVLAFLVPTIS